MSCDLSRNSKVFLDHLLDDSLTDILIHAIKYKNLNGVDSIRVMGVCQENKDISVKSNRSILNAVTVIYTKEPDHNPVTQSAIGDTIVFKDDIQEIDKFNKAYFEIDIFEYVEEVALLG